MTHRAEANEGEWWGGRGGVGGGFGHFHGVVGDGDVVVTCQCGLREDRMSFRMKYNRYNQNVEDALNK